MTLIKKTFWWFANNALVAAVITGAVYFMGAFISWSVWPTQPDEQEFVALVLRCLFAAAFFVSAIKEN